MTPKWKPDILTFNAASHVYTYDGIRIPSATQVMELAGITKKYEGDKWYGERGTAVHLACKLLNEGTLDWTTLDPQIEPFVRCYEQFRAAQPRRIVWNEQPAACTELGFACTPDLIVEMEAGTYAVVDLKTGKKSRAVGVQTALQALCFKWRPMPLRYGLYLREGEPADPMLYDDAEDYDAARGAVAVAKWRLRHMRKWPSGEMGEDAMVEA